MEELEIIEGVRVYAVTANGDDLVIDVYGGTEHVCATVIYTVADVTERLRHHATARRWRDEGTPLTYLAREDGFVALFDEEGATEELLSALDDMDPVDQNEFDQLDDAEQLGEL